MRRRLGLGCRLRIYMHHEGSYILKVFYINLNTHSTCIPKFIPDESFCERNVAVGFFVEYLKLFNLCEIYTL